MDKKTKSGTISAEKMKAKLAKAPKKISCEVMRLAATLWVLFQKKDLPTWAKAIVLTALLYYLNPYDFSCDFIPVVGYVDDIAAMSIACAQLYAFVDSSVRKEVDRRLPKRCRAKIFTC